MVGTMGATYLFHSEFLDLNHDGGFMISQQSGGVSDFLGKR